MQKMTKDAVAIYNLKTGLNFHQLSVAILETRTDTISQGHATVNPV